MTLRQILMVCFCLGCVWQSPCRLQKRTIQQYNDDCLHFSYNSDWRVAKREPSSEASRSSLIQLIGPHSATIIFYCRSETDIQTVEEYAATIRKIRARRNENEVEFASGPVTERIAGRQQAGFFRDFQTTLLFHSEFFIVAANKDRVIITLEVAKENLAEARPGWQEILDSLSFDR